MRKKAQESKKSEIMTSCLLLGLVTWACATTGCAVEEPLELADELPPQSSDTGADSLGGKYRVEGGTGSGWFRLLRDGRQIYFADRDETRSVASAVLGRPASDADWLWLAALEVPGANEGIQRALYRLIGYGTDTWTLLQFLSQKLEPGQYHLESPDARGLVRNLRIAYLKAATKATYADGCVVATVAGRHAEIHTGTGTYRGQARYHVADDVVAAGGLATLNGMFQCLADDEIFRREYFAATDNRPLTPDWFTAEVVRGLASRPLAVADICRLQGIEVSPDLGRCSSTQ